MPVIPALVRSLTTVQLPRRLTLTRKTSKSLMPIFDASAAAARPRGARAAPCRRDLRFMPSAYPNQEGAVCELAAQANTLRFSGCRRHMHPHRFALPEFVDNRLKE